MLNIVLFEPEIPPNTGSIMRLAVNSGCLLHLIKPLGFSLDDKLLRRAGLDYIPKSSYFVHENFESFLSEIKPKRVFLCSTKAKTIYANVAYEQNDTFVFGPETRGLPTTLLNSYAEENKIYIPMQKDGRSLNLAMAVSIIIYEAWRQVGFK